MIPQVTVLMSVFNGGKHLREAIDSMLSQSLPSFEFLIIDDGSTDESAAIVRSYEDRRIRFVQNPGNLGLTASLNRGLKLARAPLVARMDADDRAYPHRLLHQVFAMNADPTLVLVGGRSRPITDRGRRVPTYRMNASEGIALRWQFLLENPFVHSSVMFRKTVVDELGPYAAGYACEDFELWSRMADRYRVRNIPEVVLDRRITAGSISNSWGETCVPSFCKVLQFNASRILGADFTIDPEWLRLHAGVFTRDPNIKLSAAECLVSGYSRLFSEFARRFGQAHDDKDLRMVMASQKMFAAEYLASVCKTPAIRALRSAWTSSRGIVIRAWPKFCLMWLLGKRSTQFRARLLGAI